MPRLDEVTTQAYNRVAPTSVLHRGLALGAGGGGGGLGYGFLDASAETILADPDGGSNVSNFNYGEVFTIDSGGDPLTAVGLRLLAIPASPEETVSVALWDNATQALIAREEIIPIADAWVEAYFGASYELTPGKTYTVSSLNTNGQNYYRNAGWPTEWVSPGITFVRSSYNGTAGSDGYPATQHTGLLRGISDIIQG